MSTSYKTVTGEFGFYPLEMTLGGELFSISTLPELKTKADELKASSNFYENWIYPGAQHSSTFNGIVQRPYCARIFSLPFTHTITLNGEYEKSDLQFAIWCLSFFVGMRLTTFPNGFLDGTPLKPGALTDFILKGDESKAIETALRFLESEDQESLAAKRISAVIHALFMAQFKNNLPFEQFQYLYMALDACYKIVETKIKPDSTPTHNKRIQWLCEQFSITTPDWAEPTSTTKISSVRNDAIHEALFFDEPLGFAIFGGDGRWATGVNVTLQMQALVCRLLVAILGHEDAAYVKSPVNTRMISLLEL